MKLRNTNPLGHVDLPLIGRSLEPGEVFEVDDKTGRALLEQVGNYELAESKTKPAKKTTASAPAAPADTKETAK